MQWKEILEQQANEAFKATNGLVKRLTSDQLDWRPNSGSNWMSVGQLLEHLKVSCGAVMFGFATGDWSLCMPEGEGGGEGQMPTAESLPTCSNLEEFAEAFAKDQAMALDLIAKAEEKDLAAKMVTAPWNPSERSLGVQFQECITHLNSHKAQLFYYLKLQGVDVNTMDLWGLGD